eukprot:TRINITY_DN56318_c0_g1_i1.p1 TRINITY_DN56318_c0_g1~~TRINITY_DN56318_c0_g1_i1.p1  ORF type:complete len:297 (-),score=53.89 TRINITY_DN56318_c0_g1_i1:235-1041(-)
MLRVGVVARHIVSPTQSSGSLMVAERCTAGLAGIAKEMAPTGNLRVALNMRNELLITGKDASGSPEGLAPSLAAAFAERLGVPVQFIPYETPAALASDAEHDMWDVAMIGADPSRAKFVSFTEPYCQIESTYAVPETSDVSTCAAVDRSGMRIAGCAGAAYVKWLERNLTKATLVTAEGHDATYKMFNDDKLEALAGLRSKLQKDASKRPGTRLLDDKFMAVQQAACTKKGRERGFQMLTEFIEEAKRSGMVKDLMVKFGVDKQLTIP